MTVDFEVIPNSKMTPLTEKAERLRHLHKGPGILVLPNAWDAASARVFEHAGFPVIGTTSAGIAASLGHQDGEKVDRCNMLTVIRRIANSVDLPLTADVEGGYAQTMDGIRDLVRQIIDAGAAGLNLEDGMQEGSVPLVQTSHHVEKIRAIAEMSLELNLPLVINARTDVYLRGPCDTAKNRFCHAVHRGNHYLEAGADCVFVPGVTDLQTIRELVREIHGPLNVLAGSGTPSVTELADAGVARVSLGSGPMRATMGLFERIAKEIRDRGTFYTFANNAISYSELQRMFTVSAGETEFSNPE